MSEKLIELKEYRGCSASSMITLAVSNVSCL